MLLLQVIMGGGRKYMFPKNLSDVEHPNVPKHGGTRRDGRNLVAEWTERTKDSVSPPAALGPPALVSLSHFELTLTRPRARSVSPPLQKGHYVWNKQQLLSLNPTAVDYLLGERRSAARQLWLQAC